MMMTASLFGLVAIQSYWIRWSIRLNEAKFDKDVFGVLNAVKDHIEFKELLQYQLMVQGDVRKTLPPEIMDYFQSLGLDSEMGIQSMKADQALIQQMLSLKELSERINPEELDHLVREEFSNRGILLKFNTGIWSNESRSFVILNNHFAVEGISPVIVNTDVNKGLYTTPYSIRLFSINGSSPGDLRVYFTNKRSIVMSTVLPTIIGSIAFTFIILLCFGYTIYVIFRQKKLSEIKTDFINNMTHELKTPIATISLAIDSISNPIISGNEAKVKRFAEIIKQENKRMLNQVERVLQIAQVEKKEFQLNVTSINMHEVIGQVVSNNELNIEQLNGSLQTKLDAHNVNIWGDLTHITNIIYNLVDNATKYSANPPEILIETSDLPGGIEVMVHDKGIGMTRDQRHYIFDKFYRVPTGNLHDVKGFGLGLSYVKAMMEAHKGSVSVKSESGKGSTFTLYFPSGNPLDII
ncbi:MAG: HAMP domain-containing sensor histidine kinase [Saprospiraceae bacterium]